VTAPNNVMMAAALDLAVAGWEVLPLNGKIPTTAHGLDDATTDAETITRWWTARPAANIGARVPLDLVVVDVDPRNGGAESLIALVDLLGPLPATLTAVSGRGDGGHHRYFLRPVGVLKARPAPGLDVKANGYMVMPPSLHPDTGRPYSWIDRDPAPLPVAWSDHLRVKPPRPRPAGPLHLEHDQAAALVRWVAELLPGNRNNGLFWAACRAAELGVVDAISNDLVAAAVASGLDEREAHQTLRSAARRCA